MAQSTIDLRHLFPALVRTISGGDYPDAKSLAHNLDLDISPARITAAKSVQAINGARFNGSEIEVDVACGIIPREIWLFIKNSSLSYRSVEDEIFGANQRTVPSRFSAGFGVLFEIGGWTCGYTAASPEGDLDALFLRDAKGASGHAGTNLSLRSTARLER